MSFYSFNSTMSINSYSIGNRTFSVLALSSTIIATWISGSGLVLDLTEFKDNGFIYFVESLGMCANLALFAWIFVPKMQKVLGKTSIASYMEEHYGQVVGNLVCILGALCSMGGIGIQFKIMGECLCFFFNLETKDYLGYSIFLSSIIIILYTSAGGIRNVVRTDIIQTVCFSIALLIGIGCFDGKHFETENLKNKIQIEKNQEIIDSKNNANVNDIYRPSFDVFINMTFKDLFTFILYLGYFAIPGFKPHVIQRVSMAKNLEQAKKAYYYASIALVIALVLSCYLSYLLVKTNTIAPNENVLKSLINSYNVPFSRVIFIIGVISMCMSTADSNLNITSVLLANDLFLTKKLKPISKIYLARALTVVVGFLSIIYAVQTSNLLSIILLSGTFYLPTVSIPIGVTILGFKITSRCCIVTILISLFFVLLCKFIIKVDFDLNFIGMVLNLCLLISYHYIIDKWNLLAYFGIKSQLKKE